jgi:hypothetical protein
VAGLLGVAGLATACSDGGTGDDAVTIEVGDPGATAGEVLARASETTGAIETGRMSFTYDYRFRTGGRTATATLQAEGAFADHGRRQELTADMTSYLRDLAGQVPAPPADLPTSMAMHVVQDGSVVYMRFDIDPPEPGSGLWYSFDYAELGVPTGSIEQPAGLGGGVSSFVESLKGAGQTVDEVGTEEIDGVPVTRFEGTIDPQAALRNADPDKVDQLREMLAQSGMDGPMPFTAWVDDDGVMRRMSQTVSYEVGGGTAIEFTMTMDLYDLGAPVTVTPPPADQVRDASELGGGLVPA